MINSFTSADRFDEGQNSASESRNLDEDILALDKKSEEHKQEMSAMTQNATTNKQSEMEALMRQLNGEPEPKTIESTPYSPKNILSQLSVVSQKS